VLSPCASSCWARVLATTTCGSMRVASADIHQEHPVSYPAIPAMQCITSRMLLVNATPFAFCLRTS
jgi:hypothetical protein